MRMPPRPPSSLRPSSAGPLLPLGSGCAAFPHPAPREGGPTGFRGSPAVAPPVHDLLPEREGGGRGLSPLLLPLVLPLILQPLPRRASRDQTNSARFERMSRVLNVLCIPVFPGYGAGAGGAAPGGARGGLAGAGAEVGFSAIGAGGTDGAAGSRPWARGPPRSLRRRKWCDNRQTGVEGESRMATTFRPYEPDQMLLLAPDVRDWLPEGHFAIRLAWRLAVRC